MIRNERDLQDSINWANASRPNACELRQRLRIAPDNHAKTLDLTRGECQRLFNELRLIAAMVRDGSL
ncbi:MAG: hypothetical protein E6Q97_38595 [Desulfurellales bacterium]|nr:MAG: hypothetical protein E6Q97_38595 [Desulfurellales bacterium]